jgi:hypothetical protein
MSNTVLPDPASKCPVCGVPLAANAPQGLCPQCLLEGASAATEPDPNPPSGHQEPPALEAVRAAFPQLEVIGGSSGGPLQSGGGVLRDADGGVAVGAVCAAVAEDALGPAGGFQINAGWLEPNSESVHWMIERNGTDRPGLGFRWRTFAHGLGRVELTEQGFAGAGTNWAQEFSPSIRTAPPVYRFTEIIPQPPGAHRQSALFRIPQGLEATFELWVSSAPALTNSPTFEG